MGILKGCDEQFAAEEAEEAIGENARTSCGGFFPGANRTLTGTGGDPGRQVHNSSQ